jgi:hypothetical protein
VRGITPTCGPTIPHASIASTRSAAWLYPIRYLRCMLDVEQEPCTIIQRTAGSNSSSLALSYCSRGTGLPSRIKDWHPHTGHIRQLGSMRRPQLAQVIERCLSPSYRYASTVLRGMNQATRAPFNWCSVAFHYTTVVLGPSFSGRNTQALFGKAETADVSRAKAGGQ